MEPLPKHPNRAQLKPQLSYKKPILLLVFGAMLSLLIGGFLAWRGFKTPQCPSHQTTMPDGGHCIIGANFSAFYVLYGLAFAFGFAAIAGIWMLMIWRKNQNMSS
jgi:hypothetical protein